MRYIKRYENYQDLYVLDLTDTNLKELPKLSKELKKLYCFDNKIEELPELPNSLNELRCGRNKLEVLPKLPDTLELLSCPENKLEYLPKLPNTLIKLLCHQNKLKELPELPDTLKYLCCDDNPFEYPLPKEIVDKYKFKNHNLYTMARLKVFNTKEWQREFLTKFPEKWQDIEWITHPDIKIEFDYLFGSKDLGIL